MRRTPIRLTQLETRDTPVAGFSAAGAVPGGAPLVAVFRPDGSILAQFPAFEDAFRGGVRAAAAELDGDPNTQELVAGAGPGGGPAVKVFSVDVRTGAIATRSAFFAFEPTFTGGVRVAAGNVAARADGLDQIVIGAGEGGGPRVRTVDLNGTQVDSALGDFFAYEPSFRGGVQVTTGELDGRTVNGAELAVAAGTGGGPRVRVLRSDGAVLADYFAFNSAFRGGANVQVVNGQLVPDAFALDPSQRNTDLNTAALTAVRQTTPLTTPVNTAGVNGLGTVNTIGGTGTNVGGGVPNIGGAVTAGDLGAATGVSGLGNTTNQTGIASTVGGVGGVGTSAVGGGISSATGVTGTGGNAINNLGISAANQAGGVSGNAINNFGITGATSASGLSGNAINNFGVTGASGFNTGLAGTGFTTSGVNGSTVGNGLNAAGFGTGLTNTAGFGVGLNTTTGFTPGLTTSAVNATPGLTTSTLTVPSAFAFGAFGNPGPSIATPALANPPFVLGVTRYAIPV